MGNSEEIEAATRFAKLWVPVSHAARDLGVDSAKLYRMLQRGELEGLCSSGRWLVSAASVARVKKARVAETKAQQAR